MGSIRDLPPPPALAELAREQAIALFLDFDGTLVGIADRPELIDVPETLARDLLGLAEALEGRLAIISGRSIADLHRHIGDVALAFGGSHGLEVRLADGTSALQVPSGVTDDLSQALARYVADSSGLSLETKSLGAAIHYRASPDREPEVVATMEALAEEHGFSVKRGKCVVELVPPGASKAAAVRAFMQHQPFLGARPVFVGDDITDEDGFLAATEFGGFGIAVGERWPQNARYRLASPGAVRDWSEL